MLDFNPDDIKFPNGHYVDGALISGGAEHLAVRRPSDNQVYAHLPIAGPEVVDRAVAGAERAFQTTSWATGAPRERARILRRWADLIEANAVELGRIEALGSTRPVKDFMAVDLPYAADCIRFFAEHAPISFRFSPQRLS